MFIIKRISDGEIFSDFDEMTEELIFNSYDPYTYVRFCDAEFVRMICSMNDCVIEEI